VEDAANSDQSISIGWMGPSCHFLCFNVQCIPILSVAMELTLVKVYSKADVSRNSAAVLWQ